MYGPLANILLSCYGVGMEVTYRGVIFARTDTHDQSAQTSKSMVFVEPKPDYWAMAAEALGPNSSFRAGDEVEVTIRKVSAEVPTDVE